MFLVLLAVRLAQSWRVWANDGFEIGHDNFNYENDYLLYSFSEVCISKLSPVKSFWPTTL